MNLYTFWILQKQNYEWNILCSRFHTAMTRLAESLEFSDKDLIQENLTIKLVRVQYRKRCEKCTKKLANVRQDNKCLCFACKRLEQ